MIVLMNLNSYLGGGEVLLLRYAKYLQVNNFDYIIMCSQKSYIHNVAKKENLNYFIWPSNKESLIYAKRSDCLDITESLSAFFKGDVQYRLFTFCLRDLYNAIKLAEIKDDIFTSIVTGIYHPLDYKYLSSFSLFSNSIISTNRSLLMELELKDAVIYLNQIGARNSILRDCQHSNRILPIPITLNKKNSFKINADNLKSFRITTISRFVAFKMPAILHFLATAKNLHQYKFIIIGHGTWEFIIRLYIKLFKLSNVEVLCNVSHNSLDQYIIDSDLGFAQGTSALEFASRGVPVVVAPYSSLISFLLRKKYYVHDFFGYKDLHLGDEYYHTMGSCSNLRERIDFWFKNKKIIQFRNDEGIKSFDSNIIFDGMTEIINTSKADLKSFTNFKPRVPVFKKTIKWIVNR